MATISIVREHHATRKRARDVADQVMRDLARRFNLEYAWDGDEVRFERPGVSGELAVDDHDVRLEIRLGLLLGALKSVVEREVHAQLERLFAAAPASKPRKGAVTRSADAEGASGPLPAARPKGTANKATAAKAPRAAGKTTAAKRRTT